MEFFNKIGKKASGAYKDAAEKTGKLAKSAKLKIKISEDKSKIKEIYEEIGKKVYQKHTAQEDLCIKETLEEECKKIDEIASEIEEYEKEILELENMKQCENCKQKIEKDAKFCPSCGKEQPEIVEETVEESEVLEGEVIDNEDSSKEENNTEDNKE